MLFMEKGQPGKDVSSIQSSCVSEYVVTDPIKENEFRRKTALLSVL